MEKKYVYTYKNDKLVTQRPLSEKEAIKCIENASMRGFEAEDYQVYELVPVKLVTTTTLKRVSE